MGSAIAVLRLPWAVRRHWGALLVIAVGVALHVVAGMSLALPPGIVEQAAAVDDATPPSPNVALPRPEPMILKAVTPQDAVAWNASIPIADLPNPAARPFALAAASAADRARSLDCLTAAVYYEAAVEPTEGQQAVAQVVLNRVRHPAYPGTVCGVVFEGAERATGCQFTFTCDGSLRRTPSEAGWARARRVAEAALQGFVYAPVGWATHYHTNWVVPYWASSLVKSANVGTHIFYRWTGGWGRPPAFTGRHAGVEPAIAWRGGFGQAERMAEAEETMTAQARDAAALRAAADAAVEQATGHSVDSFQRAVLRRYEPMRGERANEMIAERVRSRENVTASQRWALTGDGGGVSQAPLGRSADVSAETTAR